MVWFIKLSYHRLYNTFSNTHTSTITKSKVYIIYHKAYIMQKTINKINKQHICVHAKTYDKITYVVNIH